MEELRQIPLLSVSVTGGDLTVVEGHDVTLPCKMTEQEKTLTQISWRRKTRGMPGNPFFFTIAEENSPSFVDDPDPRISFIGKFAERDGTLQISKVSLNDEGSYTCIFSLFPSGIYSTEIPLRVEDMTASLKIKKIVINVRVKQSTVWTICLSKCHFRL
uniref:Ig-like domain-containing protein n=1 Tax=Salarias fasciatus TaxID=181472 RepID=A0A672GRX9_SALFA